MADGDLLFAGVLMEGMAGGAIMVHRAPRHTRFTRAALLGPHPPAVEVERPEWLGGWPYTVTLRAHNGTWVYRIDTFSSVDQSMTAHLIEGDPLL